jgi:hypothetical protein
MLAKPQGAAGCKSSADRQTCPTPRDEKPDTDVAMDIDVARCCSTTARWTGARADLQGRGSGHASATGSGRARNRSLLTPAA